MPMEPRERFQSPQNISGASQRNGVAAVPLKSGWGLTDEKVQMDVEFMETMGFQIDLKILYLLKFLKNKTSL